MYAEGISRTGSIIDLGVETKILEKKGAWISYKGKLIGQGREAAKDHLVKNPKDMEEISAEIMLKVQVVGGTTLGETEKEPGAAVE
jgi:recombination protein RecA